MEQDFPKFPKQNTTSWLLYLNFGKRFPWSFLSNEISRIFGSMHRISPSKKTLLCCCFFFLKVRGAIRFLFEKNLELHLCCHTCWLNYFTLVWLRCRRTVGRAVGRCTVTWLPNFLGWVVYNIFYPWCSTARTSRARAPLLVHFVVLNGCILFNIGQYRYRYWFCWNLNITFADNINKEKLRNTLYYLFDLSWSYKWNVHTAVWIQARVFLDQSLTKKTPK